MGQQLGAEAKVSNLRSMSDTLHSWISGLGRLKDQNPVPLLAILCAFAFITGLAAGIRERRPS